MADDFSAVTVRENGQPITFAWFNALRTAGLRAPSCTKYTFAYSDLSAAATTYNAEIFSLAAMGVMHGIAIKHTTAFSGGSVTACTISVGIASDLDKHGGPFDVYQAVGDTVFDFSSTFGIEDFGSATSIRIAAESTGDDLDQLTAGSVDIYVFKSVLPTSV